MTYLEYFLIGFHDSIESRHWIAKIIYCKSRNSIEKEFSKVVQHFSFIVRFWLLYEKGVLQDFSWNSGSGYVRQEWKNFLSGTAPFSPKVSYYSKFEKAHTVLKRNDGKDHYCRTDRFPISSVFHCRFSLFAIDSKRIVLKTLFFKCTWKTESICFEKKKNTSKIY